MRQPVAGNLVVIFALLLIGFSLAHSFEDFVYGVPARFGFSLWAAAILVALFYVVQIALLVFSARGHDWSYLANALVGLLWLAGAVADHGHAFWVPFYREGWISKALIAGIVFNGLILSIAGYLAWRAARHPPERRWRQRPGAL